MGGQKVKKFSVSYWIIIAIGLFFMLIFPRFNAIDPITPVGMTILGVFIGMVFLWSAADSIWPSILGMLLIGLSGYVPDLEGYDAVKNVFLNAFGNETTMVIVLGLVFFAGLDYVGCTKYLARAFLSVKALEGRPYVFLFIFFLCSYFIGGLAQPMASMLLLWPISMEICNRFGYKKGDKIFYILICGVYFASTLGQPMFPFKGASYIIVSAFQNNTGIMINYAAYIAFNIIMSILMLVLFILFLRFIIRPDVEGFKRISVEELTKEELPKMNAQQKAFFIATIVYIVALIIPSFLPKTIGWVALLNRMGLIGITTVIIAVLMIIPFEGGRMMDFKGIAKKSFAWDIYFLVSAALYACNAMTNDATGIKPFLVNILQPLLGGKSEIVFIAILFAFAIITTNFANNAGMALVLLPICAAFMEQYQDMNFVAVYMSITMMVFLALLTPAASPYCGMLHAQRDLVSYKQIISLFLPMFCIGYLMYVVVGYQVASILFG